MPSVIRNALHVVIGLALAWPMIGVGLFVLSGTHADSWLGAWDAPLVGGAVLGFVHVAWMKRGAETPAQVDIRTAVLAGILIAIWAVMTPGRDPLEIIWLKTAAATYAALVAHEGRLALQHLDANGGRQVDVDDREIAVAAHALVIMASGIAAWGAWKSQKLVAHWPSPLQAEAAGWAHFTLFLATTVLLLRVGANGGELHVPRGWGETWLRAGDAVIEAGWRLAIVAQLCALAAHLPLLTKTSHIIGPSVLVILGLVLAALSAVLLAWTVMRWSSLMARLEDRLQTDGFGMMLLVLIALVGFWVAVATEWIGYDGLYALLFAAIAGSIPLALAATHVTREIEDWLLQLVWIGMAAPLALLALAITKETAVAWILLTIAIVVVVGLPFVRNAHHLVWLKTLTPSGEQTTSGGRARDGERGEQLRRE